MNQTDKLYRYLKMYRTIDPMQALRELGIYRLGARIWDLREQGINIRTTMKPVKPRKGERKTCVAEYRLVAGSMTTGL